MKQELQKRAISYAKRYGMEIREAKPHDYTRTNDGHGETAGCGYVASYKGSEHLFDGTERDLSNVRRFIDMFG